QLALQRIVLLSFRLDPPRPERSVRRDQWAADQVQCHTSRAARGWAEDAGMVWTTHGLRTRCRCRAFATRLVADGPVWTCDRCRAVRWSLLELAVGRYACALRLGLTGGALSIERTHLARRLARGMPGMRRVRDLTTLAAGAALLEQTPRKA